MRHIYLFPVMALMAVGCSVYHPQAVDIPLLEEAGETRAEISIAVSSSVLPDVVSFNGTVSHAFNDWLAGQAHVNGGSGVYYAQLAPGAYMPLGEKGILEGYAGIGFGGSSDHTGTVTSEEGSSYTYSFHGNYSVPFVQANIGLRHLWIFELAFGMKVGAYLPNYSYTEFDNNGDVRPDASMLYRTTSLLLEPQLQLRIGGEHVKFTTRASFCWLSDMDNGGYLYSGPNNLVHDIFTFGTGLSFTF